ncbi:MAG TPA: cob(I)yrinic acid a,c-diamide adenosyltransferase [Thermoleophilia bacterium]|nr:cob(I)yrinic acid a,c-diamide adenosyltransferase [Thermoleophilia bacterium]
MLGSGRVIVNTGDGKGKTTAAFGAAFRAAGHGLEVAVVQFIKGSWDYGESKAAQRFPNITLTRIGSGYTWMAEDPAVPKRLAREAWAVCFDRAASDRFDLLIMDELNCAVAEGFIEVEEVLAFLRNKPLRLSVIITGRDAKPEIVAEADTVTEMRCIKHAFDQGVPARKGIEY